MNYIGLSTCDTANGPGVRVSLFVSGCRLKCPGCFNPESWAFDAGKPYTAKVEERILKALEDPYIEGLSLLGGDPLEPENEPELTKLVEAVRGKFGDKKTVWVWTGRRYEKVSESPLLKLADVVVDGPFVQSKKVMEKGCWYGSTNQRVIPLKPGKVD